MYIPIDENTNIAPEMTLRIITCKQVSAGERSIMALKPMRRVTSSLKQRVAVVPPNGLLIFEKNLSNGDNLIA